MATWDDAKRFHAETVRTLVLAVVGAVAGLLIIQPWQDRSKTALETRAKVIDEFLIASQKHFFVVFDACRSLSGTDLEVRLRADTFREYTLVSRRLQMFFNDKRLLDLAKRTEDHWKELVSACTSKGDWLPPLRAFDRGNNDLAHVALRQLKLVDPIAGGRIVP